jgi:transketolase
LYAVLADLGFFGLDVLDSFCQSGSILGSHPDKSVPGVEATTGSLGHGLGIAAGMSLAAKKDKKAHKILALLGDGECSEGSVWEAAMFASFHQLDNLIGIIDHISLTDYIDNIAQAFCREMEGFRLR